MPRCPHLHHRRLVGRLAGAAALLLLLAGPGCSPADGVPPDGGAFPDALDGADAEDGADGDDGPPPVPPDVAPPEPPAAPEAPRLVDWTCPAGWRSRPVLEGTPWTHQACSAPELPDSCPSSMWPGPAAAGCQPFGSACPAGDFPDDLPGPPAQVIYVQPGVAAGSGSGTRADPFGTLAEALADAAPGAIVAVGKGTLTEDVTVAGDLDLTLRGACAALTRLQGASSSDDRGTVQLDSGTLQLRDLEIGGDRPGVRVAGGAHLRADAVRVSGATRAGLFLDSDATAEVSDLHVANTSPSGPPFNDQGIGIYVDGGQLAGERVLIERSAQHGLAAQKPSAQVTLADLAIRQTLGQPARPPEVQSFGFGLSVIVGAAVELDRAHISGSRGAGLQVSSPAGQPASRVVARDLHVTDTALQESDTDLGYGIDLVGGATLELTRGVVERATQAGIHLDAAGGSVTATADQLLVLDTQLDQHASGPRGFGVLVNRGAIARLGRTVVADNRVAGVVLASPVGTPPGELELTDAVIRATRPTGVGRLGIGIDLGEGSSRLERVAVDKNGYLGVRLLPQYDLQAGPTLSVVDLTVSGTRAASGAPPGLSPGGFGFAAFSFASLSLERARLSGNQGVGLAVFQADPDQRAPVTLADLTVESTGPFEDGTGGQGVSLAGALEAKVSRAAIRENRLTGLRVSSLPDPLGRPVIAPNLTVTDLDVGQTEAEMASGTGGQGLFIEAEAVTLQRVRVQDSVTAGIQGASAAGATGSLQITATDVEVAGTADVEGSFGDGWAVQSAQVKLQSCRVSDSQRAGLFALEGHLEVSRTELDCNAIDLNAEGEVSQGVIEDAGGNLCGCDGVLRSCAVRSSELQPPIAPPLPVLPDEQNADP